MGMTVVLPAGTEHIMRFSADDAAPKSQNSEEHGCNKATLAAVLKTKRAAATTRNDMETMAESTLTFLEGQTRRCWGQKEQRSLQSNADIAAPFRACSSLSMRDPGVTGNYR